MVTSQDAQEVSAKNKEWDKSRFQRQLNTLIHTYMDSVMDVANRPGIYPYYVMIQDITDNVIFWRTPSRNYLAKRSRLPNLSRYKKLPFFWKQVDRLLNLILTRFSSIGYIYIAKLFLVGHIKRRLKDIIQFLQFEETRLTFSEAEAKEKTDFIKKTIQDVRKLDSLLKKYTSLQIFTVSSSTIFATLTFITKVSTVNIWSQVKHSKVFLALFFIVVGSVGYLLSQLVSSLLVGFSLKRSLMLERRIYKKEKQIYKYMGYTSRPKEFPFDMVFSIVLVAVYPIFAIILEKYISGTIQLPPKFIIGIMVSYFLILLFALFGRINSGLR
jgi:hypothetical protein